MNPHLDTIVELQSNLSDLKEAEQRLHGIPDWMRELHDEHVARKSEIDALERSLEEAARERRTAEAVTQDAQEKLKKYQQQINRVSNQREYGALLQEIDTVKGQISGQEEAALASLDRAEKAQKDLADLHESFRELDERYSAELARWESEKPGVAQQAEEYRAKIAAIKGGLSRGVVSSFERILLRYPGGALSPIRIIERPGTKGQKEWHCTACNYRVRPQTLVEVRNGTDLIQCDSCKRILYVEESE